MSPQQTIAHYRITAKLGEGSMGAVYRATDTKLNREVAIKVLPDSFAADPDRLARFTRESQVLASLNHSNIAQIYGVEERALVMELVEGPTLEERIARGAMPLEEALPIAGQIAEALEYAHEKNVVHRDLKPANIKITSEGKVKVLDFGLAKAMSSGTAVENPASSPTLTMRATQMGVIVGTPAYMSPEQARGQEVDARADIWAFGVLLYEMLIGRPLFAGPTISDTLATVLKTEPDLSAIPSQVRPTLERCLRKDPRRRWRAIADVRMSLEEEHGVEVPRRAGARAAWVIATLLLVATAAGWLMAWRAARPVDRPMMRLSVDLGPDALPGLNLTAAISPDGRRLVFPARGPDGKQQLATRLLGQAQITLLPGTEGGRDPFFSPDGKWVGFVTGQLKKVSVLGGAALMLGTASGTIVGASWGEDGHIIYTPGPVLPLFRIPDVGGTPQAVTRLAAGELTHRWPQILPGGGAVLFTASPSATGMDNANIQAVSLKTGQIKVVERGGYYGRYLPSGHLVYLHQGVLFGVKFDLRRLEVRGTPVPLLDDLGATQFTGGGQFDFSGSLSGPGTFVYAAGKMTSQTWQLAWLDGSGNVQPTSVHGAYGYPRVSPDGRKLVVLDDHGDVYMHDLERDTATRLTFAGDSNLPIWARDGKHILFAKSSYGIAWMRSDGAGDPYRLLESPNLARPWSVSPDGRRLAYFERNPETGFDIWTLPLDLTDPDRPKAGKPELFLRTPANEILPRFSPDGRWIAYRSDETGSVEIYVRPFPATSGGKWQIVRLLVEQRPRAVLRNNRQPDHGSGLHRGWRVVYDGEAPAVVGQAALLSRHIEPRSDARRQAIRRAGASGSGKR
jgi:predicted Ser/Thr protein kinase